MTMAMFEISIPQTSNYQVRHSAFQWTLTILDEPKKKRRLQYSSINRYEEIGKIEINGYSYERLIFDFEQGKIHISLKERNTKAVINILEALTIQTSPSSQVFLLMRYRKRPNQEK
jgi:plasmid maintenance system killer protein